MLIDLNDEAVKLISILGGHADTAISLKRILEACINTFHYHGYVAQIGFHCECGRVHGTAKKLDGSMVAFCGDTLPEALAEFYASVDDFEDFANEYLSS